MAYTNQIGNYGSFRYVVTPGASPYATIQSAIDQAFADSVSTTIFIRPGTYTESLTLYNGINLQGSEEGQVVIVGTHTPPLAGSFSIKQCVLQSTTDIFSSIAAGTSNLVVENCTFRIDAGYIFNILNWLADIRIDNCLELSTINDIMNNTGGSFIEILNSSVGTAGGTGMISSGVVRIVNSRIFCKMSIDAAATIDGSTIGATITTLVTSAGDVSINNSFLDVGAARAIVTDTAGVVTISDTTINSSLANVITGTSTIELASVTFLDGEGLAGVTVLTGSEFRCNHAYATTAMTILKGDFNLTDGLLNINGDTGDDGQLIIGSTAGKPEWASLAVSGVLTKTEGAGTLELTVPANGLPYVVAAADLTAVPNTAYSIQHGTPATLLTVTLPDVADSTAGDVIHIMGYTVGGWTIAQSDAAHQIVFGNQATTLGAAGTLSSSLQYDCVTIRCIDGSVWQVETGPQGNLTVV